MTNPNEVNQGGTIEPDAGLEKKFYEDYTVKMIRNGRTTTLIAALATFLPALYL